MISLNHANLNDASDIIKIFYLYRDIFPHIRKDYIDRNLEKGNVIFENDVVIIYNKYMKKTRLGNIHAVKGNFILHQIVTKHRDGRATQIFQKFLNEMDDKLFLTVRSSNLTAINFYERNGMTCVGDIAWKNNTLPGKVFLYTKSNNHHEKFTLL